MLKNLRLLYRAGYRAGMVGNVMCDQPEGGFLEQFFWNNGFYMGLGKWRPITLN